MTRALHGIIHGKMIELEQDPGIGDGDRSVTSCKGIKHGAQMVGR